MACRMSLSNFTGEYAAFGDETEKRSSQASENQARQNEWREEQRKLQRDYDDVQRAERARLRAKSNDNVSEDPRADVEGKGEDSDTDDESKPPKLQMNYNPAMEPNFRLQGIEGDLGKWLGEKVPVPEGRTAAAFRRGAEGIENRIEKYAMHRRQMRARREVKLRATNAVFAELDASRTIEHGQLTNVSSASIAQASGVKVDPSAPSRAVEFRFTAPNTSSPGVVSERYQPPPRNTAPPAPTAQRPRPGAKAWQRASSTLWGRRGRRFQEADDETGGDYSKVSDEDWTLGAASARVERPWFGRRGNGERNWLRRFRRSSSADAAARVQDSYQTPPSESFPSTRGRRRSASSAPEVSRTRGVWPPRADRNFVNPQNVGSRQQESYQQMRAFEHGDLIDLGSNSQPVRGRFWGKAAAVQDQYQVPNSSSSSTRPIGGAARQQEDLIDLNAKPPVLSWEPWGKKQQQQPEVFERAPNPDAAMSGLGESSTAMQGVGGQSQPQQPRPAARNGPAFSAPFGKKTGAPPGVNIEEYKYIHRQAVPEDNVDLGPYALPAQLQQSG